MRTCLPCLAALLLAACGSSGGLYLPDQPPKHDSPVKKDLRKTADQPQAQTPAAAPDQTAPTPQP